MRILLTVCAAFAVLSRTSAFAFSFSPPGRFSTGISKGAAGPSASASQANTKRLTGLNTVLKAAAAPPPLSTDAHDARMDSVADYVAKHGGNRVIRRVLIANNGMAATKSILSMRQWCYMQLGNEKAIEFVAMATPEDLRANAEFIKLADSYVEVPGGKNSNNYANVDTIVKIAKEQGIDAVWPGWGHASENPALPETLEALGIRFIGPTAPVMAALGDKIAANILAQTAGVPSIPWSGDGLTSNLGTDGKIPDEVFQKAMVTTEDEAVAAANRIGYPVMLKASEGGGGKGIRMSNNDEELRTNFVQVSNEVPGSPMFMMQLCQGARHLEVQIVGDEHGNAVALNGRDCSTQRRFQKIFEEGPPVIAKRETFREMERAAQRLTQSIGYRGAGTVEYLYNAESDSFYFLELNPRLQVEHPVTEGLSLVNLPATQLQIAMGIPLNRIPDIRRFFNRDPEGDSTIDFLAEDYREVDGHVIAARITAENPDEGFKPTSGTIERVKFQSTSNVWGYFSVGANGGIHEFADSQFGHLFAKGATREDARKALVLALKEIEVRGEIRTTVDYLVQLLETEAFKQNTIDTSWLDGIIREKSVSTEMDPHTTVAAAAIYRAFAYCQAEQAAHVESLGKGQLSMGVLAGMNQFPVEISYKDVRYNFDVARISPDTFRFTVNGVSFEAKVRLQPDGSLLASFGGATRKIIGLEEPLGLRVAIDGTTCLLPNVFDPSELRTDVTGKVVRYLQGDGEEVESGEPYVEVEAMKMIMPLRASESGAIKHELSPGSIISTGDLLASLSLRDPSKVKKIEPFGGTFDLTTEEGADATFDAVAVMGLVMDGFEHDFEGAVQEMVSSAESAQDVAATIIDLLDRFLAVETAFSGRTLDEANLELVKANKETLLNVISLNLAHRRLSDRCDLVLSLLRAYDGLVGRFAERPLLDAMKERLTAITQLDGRGYGSIALQAAGMLDAQEVEPFDQRLSSLRESLLRTSVEDLFSLSKAQSLSAGVDLLSALFTDPDCGVRAKALETYIRRVYRAHTVESVEVTDSPSGALQATWTFRISGVAAEASPVRTGFISVVDAAFDAGASVAALEATTDMGGMVRRFADVLGPEPQSNKVHVMHVAFAQGRALARNSPEQDAAIAVVEGLIAKSANALADMGVRQVNLLVSQPEQDPRYFSFNHCDGYREDPLRRDMRPTFHYILELSRLRENYDIVRFPGTERNAQVYLGTEKAAANKRAQKQQVLFLRSLSHSSTMGTEAGASRALLSALDQLDRAMLDSRVGVSVSSRIFVNLLAEIDVSPSEALDLFKQLMAIMQTQYAPRLLKLKVDEIEVKIRCIEEASGETKCIRLVASSMSGKWLESSAYIEFPDPTTGVTRQFCPVNAEDPQQSMCFLDPYPTSNKLMMKRAAVRRISSTYAYDFLGLLEVELIQRWNKHLAALKASGLAEADARMPTSFFSSHEMIMGENGELALDVDRVVGTNDIGMLAWRIEMKTPEYPGGRELVLIANDVTVQSGSFGVKEDDMFQAASKYARERGLPRVYVACNSGARIGLVENLKPLFKVAWKDESNPSLGFDYLYLTQEDYASLPEGTVEAQRVVSAAGEPRYALSDIIGQVHGIGVENLRGSGTIAGETARAYDDTFTLSYITGRTVGIGAYLVRLGQRTIQMQVGPMILTGFSALNKLLGREVYTSQDQLGGPQVMYPNGVSHEVVHDDQEGVAAIMDWLAYVPKSVADKPAQLPSPDPIDRPVEFLPTKAPYDPRHMLAGVGSPDGSWVSGFFDRGSFKEYLAGWGKSVVVGRARLGGIPMGVIAVETRLVEQRIPADPANPESREALQPQAGQVWYPDSAYKTAQAINDFNRGENLPLMIFANWRGFSGGTRDMAGEILKFGSMIVDALVDYRHPVFVYIPPNGELRGGAWVVIDPTINEEVMEMYCDKESRGGILEPPGICEVKFRGADQIAKMHQLDPLLSSLDLELETATSEDDVFQIKKQIKERETALMPFYLQVAHEFADLHDRSGRMKAKGVVRDVLQWRSSREYLYWRVKRRIEEDTLRNMLVPHMEHADAMGKIEELFGDSYDSDKEFLAKLEKDGDSIHSAVAGLRAGALRNSVDALLSDLSTEERARVINGL